LLAIDGSPAAATAFPLARIIARQLHAVVEVLHVATGAALDPKLWERLRPMLQDGEALQVRANAGEPASVILQAAREPGVDVVVLTTHGRIIEPGRALGRVAQAVIANTRRPVLLGRPEAAGTVNQPLRRLLLPLDGTPTTTSALRPAVDLASRMRAELYVLYVAPPNQPRSAEAGAVRLPQYVDQPQHEWPAWRERVVNQLCACLGSGGAVPPFRIAVAYGDIAQEIGRAAEKQNSDAIVLVRRSHLEVGRARVLKAVLERTPCPVLLVSAGNS
jgi:nucleotide-binding universal stress UspA family protein